MVVREFFGLNHVHWWAPNLFQALLFIAFDPGSLCANVNFV